MKGAEIKIFHRLEEIPETSWASLVPGDFPFVSWKFLRALEENQCLGERTGWTPIYLTAWGPEAESPGPLLAALICYVKSNSYGEYIFDFQWAQAFQMQRVPYYPKLTSAVPFTPATGPKLLGAPEHFAGLLQAWRDLARRLDCSGLHALFVPLSELKLFESNGFFTRHSYQYHWHNQGYRSFEDFLARLRGKRRREILRERSQAAASGLRIRRLTGATLTAEHAQVMHRFYQDTVFKRGGFDYLTAGFFESVFETMKDSLMLVLAETANGVPVAGALNYFGTLTRSAACGGDVASEPQEGRGNGKLFGRHWGCLQDYKSLHFELCYYQGIEFAIERGLDLFEAGAQGEHKFQRGFLPSLTYSAHEIFDPALGGAIQRFADMEKIQLSRMLEEYEKSNPYSPD